MFFSWIDIAVAIARRAARLSERISDIYGCRGLRNALPAPEEARRHVWRHWAKVRKDLAQRDSDNNRIVSGTTSSMRSYKGRVVTSPLSDRHVVGAHAPA